MIKNSKVSWRDGFKKYSSFLKSKKNVLEMVYVFMIKEKQFVKNVLEDHYVFMIKKDLNVLNAVENRYVYIKS